MLKLPAANHLALTDTVYTALNNVRAYLFRFMVTSRRKSSKLFGLLK
jgi:hypothetical protein